MTTASTDTNAAGSAASAVPDMAERLASSERIIHRNVLWALGAGVVPMPFFDVVAVTSVQVKMLRELSEVYKVPFKEGIVKKLVLSLFAGLGGVSIGVVLGASLFKLVPVVGHAFGIVAVPVMAGAFTHAVGRIFVMHFESGGTYLDFDPVTLRDHFRKEFEAAKEKVAELHGSAAARQS